MSIIGEWKLWDGEWDQAYKEWMPKAGIVLGGIHAALDPSAVAADPGIHANLDTTQAPLANIDTAGIHGDISISSDSDSVSTFKPEAQADLNQKPDASAVSAPLDSSIEPSAGQAHASVQQTVSKIGTVQNPFDKALAECGNKLCASGTTLDPSAGTPTGTIPTEAVATVAIASLGAAAVYTFNKLQRDCPHGRDFPPSHHGNHG